MAIVVIVAIVAIVGKVATVAIVAIVVKDRTAESGPLHELRDAPQDV